MYLTQKNHLQAGRKTYKTLYKLLPSQVAQQTMKIAERNYRFFFRLLNERGKRNYNRLISHTYSLNE